MVQLLYGLLHDLRVTAAEWYIINTERAASLCEINRPFELISKFTANIKTISYAACKD